MDTFGVFKLNATSLEAQRQGMNVIASNMANVHSTRSDEGGPYRRRDVVFAPLAVTAEPASLKGIKVDEVVKDTTTPLKIVHDPSHFDADKDGNVAMPNINVIEEMVNMMMASRAYEASITAFNTAKSMVQKTLELGRFRCRI